MNVKFKKLIAMITSVDRLEEYAIAHGITLNKIGDTCGFPTGKLHKLKYAHKGLPDDFLLKILSHYPDLDEKWLVLGEGIPQWNSFIPVESKTSKICKPLIPQRLYKEPNVNILQYIKDNRVEMLSPEQLPPVMNAYIRVIGDAMRPEIKAGDIIGIQKVNKETPIVSGEVYAIDTIALGIIIRKIFDRNDKILCRPINPEFEDIVIDKNDIYNICRVVFLYRNYFG